MLPSCEISSCSSDKPAPPLFRTDIESPRINPSPTTAKERTSRCIINLSALTQTLFKSKLDASQRSWVGRTLQTDTKTPLSLRLPHYVMCRKPNYTDYNKFHLAMYQIIEQLHLTSLALKKYILISDLRNTSSLELTK